MPSYQVRYLINLNPDAMWGGYQHTDLLAPGSPFKFETWANDDPAVLNAAFFHWNMTDNHRVRSMSVGDVAEVRTLGRPGVRFYSCDRFGWTQLDETPIEFHKTLIDQQGES